MTSGGNRYYLAYDQVGTLRAVIDSSGSIVKQVNYDTFGNILADTNLTFNMPFGFAGGIHDRHTGLVRFGYRDYSPDVGRWTAKDPIFFAGGDTDLFGYVGGDPVNLTDPEGLYWVRVGGFILKYAIPAYTAWKISKAGKKAVDKAEEHKCDADDFYENFYDLDDEWYDRYYKQDKSFNDAYKAGIDAAKEVPHTTLKP